MSEAMSAEDRDKAITAATQLITSCDTAVDMMVAATSQAALSMIAVIYELSAMNAKLATLCELNKETVEFLRRQEDRHFGR